MSNVSIQAKLAQIPDRILDLAMSALRQANTHAVYLDRGNEHWGLMSVLNAAHAGELFIKARIANAHPLLVFTKVDASAVPTNPAEIDTLLTSGKTHNFEKLPDILKSTTGVSIANTALFERLRKARNSIQHFCPPENEIDPGKLALEFIYLVIDPLIRSEFNLFAIEFHEDPNVGYDYVVAGLLRQQIRFSVPDDFEVPEIELDEEIENADEDYKAWFRGELHRIGKSNLVTF